ncbi:MAG: serine hydrolase [Prolixibacteraceae bacterium]|nr:serine hydrolase [Prolixibacteraceae bacterium]
MKISFLIAIGKRKLTKWFVPFLFFCFLTGNIFGSIPPFLKQEGVWADSVLSKMSLEEKIGQLIMVTAYSNLGDTDEQLILSQIEKYHIGGVLFLKSSPHRLAGLAQKYQQASKIPLFIAIDAENGLSFRMDSVVVYPHAMGLGAVHDDSLIYRMGKEIGMQCRRLGINLNFAPVADVNSNPDNPIINYRSFGENPEQVARKCTKLASGMQDANVLVTLKHFPGHGNTAFDSHLTLPVIDSDYTLLDSIDFIPFRRSIEQGIGGIMTAHIGIPKIDKTNVPATLSEKILTGILRDSLHFQGLVFSDGMNMKAISDYYEEGEAAVKALKAGADVIEFVVNPREVVLSVARAVRKGTISEEMIDQKCRKILLSKEWIFSKKMHPGKPEELTNDLNKPAFKLTARLLFEQSLTAVYNRDDILPLQRLDTLQIATLALGTSQKTAFQTRVESYLETEHFFIDENKTPKDIALVFRKLSNYNLVLISLHGLKMTPSQKYGLTDYQLEVISELGSLKNSVFVAFCNPYALEYLKGIDTANALIVTYGDNSLSQDYAAQLIFGATGTNSRLPVSVPGLFIEGDGVDVKKNGRLKYTVPGECRIDEGMLNAVVDSFANYGINEKIFPGCQVLIAKDGKVIFHKSYGYYTYDSITNVQNNNIYDWASLTKITGPLPLVMKLVEDSVLELDKPFSTYWKQFANADKATFTLREALAHQAGLNPWIAFYLDTFRKEKQFKRGIIRDRPSVNFPYRVSKKMYINKFYKQRILREIKNSELLKKKKYAYSDLCFILMPDLLEGITGRNFETTLYNDFLLPLGASTVKYNAYKQYTLNRFVPTERDEHFRNELLQGFVHDETAAMMGGVSGHAGLFGTTNDLAKIMQFYLNKGSYGDFHYLNSATVNEFTRIQYPKNENRRGLGFDKPYIGNQSKALKDAYPAPETSPESFGHSGYTGTFAWADPANGMLFIFMSNRVYPTRENKKLYDMNFRPALQQSVYNCLNSFEPVLY